MWCAWQVRQVNDPTAALQKLQTSVGTGSAASKQIAQVCVFNCCSGYGVHVLGLVRFATCSAFLLHNRRVRKISDTHLLLDSFLARPDRVELISPASHRKLFCAQASLAIQQVLEQSKADHKIAKAASRSADMTKDTGKSWNSLLSRESGPRAMAMASDWLSTAVATSKTKGSKTKYARAQLEAALSQVDGHYSHDAEAGAWHNEKRQRNSELQAMSNLAHAVMFKALSGQDAAPAAQVAPLAATSWSGSPSSSSNWMSNSAGAAFSAGGEGGGQSGGKAAETGAAPGLSSYDAQILAGGPPS